MTKGLEVGQYIRKGTNRITIISSISAINQRRVVNIISYIKEEYWCDFLKVKSVTESIHCLKQIEKCNEYKMELVLLFIDFRRIWNK